MATTQEILDRACRITGLRVTGPERTIVLQALQNAYRRAVMDSECSATLSAYTIPTSSDSYSLATVCGGVQPTRLLHVSMATGGSPMNLQQAGMQELLDRRALDNSQGVPCLYAVLGFENIAFYPNPAVGDRINVWYLPDTPTLVDSSGDTPSKVPVAFHWDVLLPGTVIECLDKDQRKDDAMFWTQRYERGIARLQEHIGQMGGDANRAYLEVNSGRPWLRDERWRG